MSGVTSGRAIQSLRTEVAGDVVVESDASYDEARALWNGAIDRRPSVIVRCASGSDVTAAIRFATDSGLRITARGGGHGFSGLGMCDSGLTIDLSRMRALDIDPSTRRAVAQPGVLGGEFDRAAQHHGLATTMGTISHTGIAGLTLGGGMGWLMRQYGLASDNLVAATVALADGRTVRVSTQSEPDLFWAIRGGGGNFGVVTNFEYQLHEVNTTICASQFFFPFAEAEDVLATARDIGSSCRRDQMMMLICSFLPDAPQIAAELRGQRVAGVIAFSIDPTDSQGSWLQPLRAMRPTMEMVDPMSYVDFQALFDLQNPHGLLAYCQGAFISDLSDSACATFIELGKSMPDRSLMYLQQMGGAVNDFGPDTAIQGRTADYVLNAITHWDHPDERHARRAWAADVVESLDDFTLDTVPLNFEGRPTGLDERVYGSALPRLREIKREVDPDGIFGHVSPL